MNVRTRKNIEIIIGIDKLIFIKIDWENIPETYRYLEIDQIISDKIAEESKVPNTIKI